MQTAELLKNQTIKFIEVDSRKVISPSQTLFVALSGQKTDGHHYISELYKQGCRSFLCQKGKVNFDAFPEAVFYEVEDTLVSFQELIQDHRQRFTYPVIGITGSNGKTIIKEWLYTLLEEDFRVVKSPKSYNSQIGVPLSVWQMKPVHEIGIFEAGVSKKGEMLNLQKMIQPTTGIFTNIGQAHGEGFSSMKEKVEEKASLFKDSSCVIYCKDHQLVDDVLNNQIHLSWSTTNPTADFYFELESKSESGTTFYYSEDDIKLSFPFADQASLENAFHCVITLKHLGYKWEVIQQKLPLLKGIPMRFSLKEGRNNCLVVDDTYNNDLAGLSMAIDFLHTHSAGKIKAVVFSDFLEHQIPSKELYLNFTSLLKQKGVERVVGIGDMTFKNQSFFTDFESQFFPTTEDFLLKLSKSTVFKDEAILVKGGRSFAFEKVVKFLEQRVHGTSLEINMEAIAHNLMVYRSLLKPSTKIMVMVKALSYGSGSHEVASLLQYHLVDYLGVAYTDEGVHLRENGIRTPIMVLNPSSASFDKMLKYQLEPEIPSFYWFDQLISFIESNYSEIESYLPFKIQLNFDTGMRRLGFEKSELPKLIEKLNKYEKWIEVTSAFTHLAGADEALHEEFTLNQITTFKEMANDLEGSLGYTVIKHALNSAGIGRYTEHQLDMVRLGIGLYGVDVNGFNQERLRPVSRLVTSISQIKHIKKGETVGYGRKGIAHQDMQIATIDIGYADGFDRRFSGGVGQVKVADTIVPIIGNVCMDMSMIDVTDLNVQVGDEVVIFGNDPHIIDLAKSIGTIPYEILTNVSQRVKRVYHSE
ncbi:bifunctional UDP-N-acetylmuramoyl-tripeptide:D-alanyl-D-alanine ligase/alanine racemase [Sediminitomix flava]|uniref:Alanine racemase n=1 Tax=Sediminitomix flava TaxID=379075 RepID=A0A315Z9S6_SEDFL|nr:bifunctional UDP-N-acetylmuramoyl-tripeptide:D-alanyl-D-alanine ligase/alanine racemase [Sediminitomix flava]PWJ42281.1 alanine racemase [Sediminitomix flava]